ncbi:MAG TPA: UDP-N-acetylmuramoyl-L-alanine--D-glutamate ligase [Thermoleophilaceae bacterium]|nr:UDP-N-acetylmuramoyl-L-alanine--D-glutamate ligase [Thermoleophilaceae bacterium]
MKERPPLPDGPYLVVGLARSGRAAAVALAAHGEVIACDTGHPEAPFGVEAHLGTDGVALLDRAGVVVKSPGVPAEAPVIAAARERGTPVLGELELGWRLVPGEFVAVTGTNGKTTTTELLGAIHRAAGVPVEVAGNVGKPLSALAGETGPDTVVVCECSSFQLEDAVEFAPECAVLLNLEEDHLDRHGSFEAYRDAKLRIFARQAEGDVAVAPVGLEPAGGRADVVVFGGDCGELAHRDAELVWRGEPFMGAGEVRLRGAHNLENAMAAAAAALARGIPPEAVREALASFAGVPHRLEEVAETGGVLWVNDSKATNVASAAVGIAAFEGGVHAILGGSLKGGGFGALRDPVASRCRAVYLIGEAAARIESDLAGSGVAVERCGDLETAVERAGAAARPGEVVLLSPACASFDQFDDYEHRGEVFRALVRARE